MANHGPVDLQFHTERQPYRHNWDARKNRMVHVQDPKVVESPRRPLETQSKGQIRDAHKRTHACSHTRERFLSGMHVGLEAQFFSWLNERELRLGLHCPVGRWGHLSRTPSGESALRWPHRPVPLQPKSRKPSPTFRTTPRLRLHVTNFLQNLRAKVPKISRN